MAKRKRQAVLDIDEDRLARRTKVAEAETESSTDNESLELDESLAEVRDRVRAYKGASDDEAFSDESESGSGEGSGFSDAQEGSPEGSPEDRGLDDVDVENPSELEEPSSEENDLNDEIADQRSSISFGALAKAQSQLAQQERSNHDRSATKPNGKRAFEEEALERKAGKKDDRDFNRQSKHAPAETSSKKAVSRKRSVVPIHKINVRDPRFDLIAGKVNENQIKKNYAFLSEYRDSEIAELKAGIRKTKDPRAKATMEKALKSMESRKRTEELNEQKQGVVREFRKEEARKVKDGKKPFFLKSSEIKKRALEERFKKMKSRDRTKAIERRRKKNTAKERREMPLVRRG